MKIAFIGDSYCQDIVPGIGDVPDRDAELSGYPPYPYLVAQEYDAEIIAKGLPGRHLFHSYEILLEVVDEADYTVFCVSDPFRLPNRYSADIKDINRELSLSSLIFLETESPGSKKLMKEIQTAITYYYTHLVSFDWHEVSQKGLLMQIDELMLQKKKKCIWFPCFDSSMCGFIPKSGPYASIILADAYAPYHEPNGTGPDPRAGGFKPVYPTEVNFLNHFDATGNRIIANLIIDIIERDAFDAYEIEMEQYFK